MKRILPNIYLRRPLTVIPLLAYFIFVILLFFLIRAKMTGFYLLYVLSRYAFVLFITMTTYAFLLMTSSHTALADETICACRSKGFFQTAATWFLTGWTVLFQGTILFALFAASSQNDGSSYFRTFFLKSYAYNLLLPMIICLWVAYLLARMRNTRISSILLVLFLLVISPLFTAIQWIQKPLIPVDQGIALVMLPFRICYENGNWAPNMQLGLQTEPGRGWLFLFWFALLAGITACIQIHRRGERRALALVVLAGSILLLFKSGMSEGRYRINENWDGSRQDEYYYEADAENDHAPEEAAGDEAVITSYQLNLRFRDTMTVDALLTAELPPESTTFCFTLYHGYQIHELAGESTEVSWHQDGDLVICELSDATDHAVIRLRYEGSHPLFYSFQEGAMLPGWFPWYPMSGQKAVMRNYKTYPTAYNTYNRIPTADFRLETDAPFSMACNLTETKPGCFSGSSNGISLIGGEILPLFDTQVMDTLPLEQTKDLKDPAAEYARRWQSTCRQLEGYGITPPVGADARILLASRDLCRLYVNNDIAFFDDYILTWSGGFNIHTVSVQMVLGAHPESELAGVICSMGGLSEDALQTFEDWAGSLEMWRNLSDEEPVSLVEDLLYEVLKEAGRQNEAANTVRKIAQRLCAEEPLEDLVFLEELKSEYDQN